MRLERPMVVRAALELLNEAGLDGVTTRRLADALGVGLVAGSAGGGDGLRRQAGAGRA